MRKLINEETLRTQKLAGIITENQYNESLDSASALKSLEADALEFSNSPKIEAIIDRIIADASPEELNAMHDAMRDMDAAGLSEMAGDSSFSDIVGKAIDIALGDETIEEGSEADVLKKKIGKVLDNLGVANIMSMGFLPAIAGAAMDYFAGTDILNTVSQAVGSGSGAAVLSVIAGLVGGGLLWKLGKKLQGVKVTDSTPLFEEGLEEGYSDGGKYNLSSQENVDDMMRDVIGILTKYVGTNSTNNAAVGNDNRVKIYNMLNSGEFQSKISQMIPPSSMHQAYDHEANQAQYWTNNPEAMAEFLSSIGITKHNFKSTDTNAMDNMFKGTTPDDINF